MSNFLFHISLQHVADNWRVAVVGTSVAARERLLVWPGRLWRSCLRQSLSPLCCSALCLLPAAGQILVWKVGISCAVKLENMPVSECSNTVFWFHKTGIVFPKLFWIWSNVKEQLLNLCLEERNKVLHCQIHWHIFCHVACVLLQVSGFTVCWCLGNQEQSASDSRAQPCPRKVLLQSNKDSITGMWKGFLFVLFWEHLYTCLFVQSANHVTVHKILQMHVSSFS